MVLETRVKSSASALPPRGPDRKRPMLVVLGLLVVAVIGYVAIQALSSRGTT